MQVLGTLFNLELSELGEGKLGRGWGMREYWVTDDLPVEGGGET